MKIRVLLPSRCPRRLSAWLLCLAAAFSAWAGNDPALFAADGYRIDEFRSPVPESVPAARTVDTDAVRRLIESEPKPVLVDVLPSPPRPEGLSPTALWLPPKHYNIPQSTWLPNVGYGRLSDGLNAYFRDNLARLTNGDFDKPIIIYCEADCWMSWNAARRAADYGYRRVLWFPQGTDGWNAAGLSLAPSQPAPMD